MNVFKTGAFSYFASQLRSKISEAMDPADASVESVLPGVCSRIDNLQNCLNSVQKGMNEMNSNFEAHFSNVDRKVDSVR